MKQKRLRSDSGIRVMTAIMALALLFTAVKLVSAQEAKTLLIGDILALSGPGADWGIGAARALELKAEKMNRGGEINVQGQKYNIKFVNEDDKYSGTAAVAAANKLIFTDKVKFIVGITSSASVLAFQPLVEANKVLLLCNTYAGPELLRNKKYTFRPYSPPTHMSPAFFDWMKKTYPRLKKVVHIAPNDATGWGSSQGDNDAADNVGFEVAGNEFYERGTVDFTAMLARVLPKMPDILALGGTAPGDAALIIKQARELGYKGMIQHSGMLDPDVIGPIAGWENVEGILSTAVGWSPTPNPLVPEPMREFLNDYKTKYGNVNSIAPHYPDMLTVLSLAIKKTNSLDPTTLAEAIERGDLGTFDGLYGKAYFGGEKLYGNKHQLIRNCVFSEIRNRRLEVVGLAMAWENPPPQKKWR